MKIYHNPRCGKSRAALALLRQNGVEPEVVEYLKKPLTAPELEHLAVLLHINPVDMLRKGEPLFKEKFKTFKFQPHEWCMVMAENPILMERPIVVRGHAAIIARPPERVLELLEKT